MQVPASAAMPDISFVGARLNAEKVQPSVSIRGIRKLVAMVPMGYLAVYVQSFISPQLPSCFLC